MANKIGLEAKLLIGDPGATAATELKNVKDVSLNLEKATADITTRAASGWRVKKATLKEASVEFEMNYDAEDAGFTSMISAFLGNSAVAIFVSDGDGKGLDADWDITNFNIEQPLEEAISVSVTAEPTDIGGSSGRAPTWKTA